MTVRELIEWLERLPNEAQGKPVVCRTDDCMGEIVVNIDTVDYNLSVVTLR